MKQRYIVMMRTGNGWLQCGCTYLSEQAARDALNEYKRGPNLNDTFRIFVELPN